MSILLACYDLALISGLCVCLLVACEHRTPLPAGFIRGEVRP